MFLTRTAVLERMSGPLCEAVLESARLWQQSWRTWLGRTCCWCRWTIGEQWYRYHHLFRDMLLAELERLEPGPDPGLAAARRRVVPGERPARGGTGVLHRRRGCRHGRSPGARNCGFRSTGRPGSRPSSGGFGGSGIGAGSRDTPCAPWWPRSSVRTRGGRSRPSGGPMRSIAGRTQDATRPEDLAAEGMGRRAAGLLVPPRSRADAHRRRRSRATSSRRRASWHRSVSWPKGSRGSFAVISRVATHSWRMRPA